MNGEMGEMEIAYSDSCVFIAALDNEPNRADVVEAQFTALRARGVSIVTSTITLSEVAYASTEPTPINPSNTTAIDELMLRPRRFRYLPVSRAIALGARELVREAKALGVKRIRTPDAIHLATAREIKADLFLTYDQALLEIRLDLPFRIEKPSADVHQVSLPNFS